jgi:general secretion pathway protein H
MTSLSERGFTLVEILVVLAILGLALGLVAMRGSPGHRGLSFEGTATGIVGALRQARSEAVIAGRPVRFVVDTAARTWRIDDGAPNALPAGIDVALSTITGETSGERVAAFRFAPDGSATGGAIVLSQGGQSIRIGIDWLTGKVGVAHGP